MHEEHISIRPDVSIVFTNWNVRDLLRDCLHSVYERTSGLTYEIIVVDDGSTDGSIEMLRSEFPEVTLLANPKNIGVAKSYNRGVAVASGRYIQMLNTDMILVNNAIKILYDYLESHPEVGACAGKLRNRDMTPQVSYGSFPSLTISVIDAFALRKIFPWIRFPSIGDIPSDCSTEPMDVEYLSGADMLIRREVIDEISFFDERYTSYCEETDFCYRILHGTRWKLRYVPQSEIIHFGGMSFANVREYQVKLLFSSYDKFFRKHHGPLYSYITRSFIAIQYGRKWVVARLILLLTGREDQKLRCREFAWHFKYVLFPEEKRT